MLLADDLRRQRPGGRGERIDRGIDAQLGNRPLQDDRRIEMGEGGGRCRIGQVVGRHVHRLEGGDGAVLRGGYALLERAHLGGERRLIPHRAGGPTEESGDLGAGLREAEDVVDEEEHVLVLLVAKVLRDREARERHAEAGPRRFVHLAVDQSDLRRARVLLVDDARPRHFVVQVVTFARALADAGEYRHTAVELGDVVDELHDDDCLPDASTTERADLAALQEGTDQIDHLDARGEHLGGGGLVHQRGRRAVYRIVFLRLDRAAFVDGAAGHVEHATQHAVADRHADRPPTVQVVRGGLQFRRQGFAERLLLRDLFEERGLRRRQVLGQPRLVVLEAIQGDPVRVRVLNDPEQGHLDLDRNRAVLRLVEQLDDALAAVDLRLRGRVQLGAELRERRELSKLRELPL